MVGDDDAVNGRGNNKRSISRSISQMGENLAQLLDDVDDDQRGLGEGDKAAMARLGATLFDLIVHYVQTFSTISRSPTAKRIWADWDLPDLFGWFTLDLFVLPVWDMPELGLGVQTKIFALLLPVVFLYWVSEVVWSDSVKWRRDYVDDWAQTKKQLSPYNPLVPVFPSLVTGVGMSMAMLIFVVPKVTIVQGITTFLGFYLIQMVYGAAMLVVVSLAKVYYAEYRHETIDEDLPTEHMVDQRPDFFYGIRANARQAAQVLLGVFYLPLCIGVLHLVEEVRHLVREREDALPTCVLCNWYAEGIERYALAVSVLQVSCLVVIFTVGAPVYMLRVIKQRREHFVWLDAQEKDRLEREHDDVQRDRRLVLKAVQGGSALARRVGTAQHEEAQAMDAMGLGHSTGDKAGQSRSSTSLSEKGKWVWSPVSERPHREYNIFQLEEMVSTQLELGVPWFVTHRTLGKICCCCRKRFLTEHEAQHGSAVRRSIEELQEARRVEWEFGYEDYQRKQGEMSGMDSMWMCCSQRWTYWKVYTGFFEKYILFALSANMLSSLVNKQCYSTFRAKFTYENRFVPSAWEDGSWNTTTFTTEGSLDNQYTNNQYTAGLGIFETGGSAAGDTGSWSTEVTIDHGCEKVTAIGMLSFCSAMFLLGVVCQPFLDVKQDKVDSACRFAGTSTSFALVLAVYEVFDEIYVLLIVLIPNLLAIIYAVYIINPGEMAAAIAVEIRSFLRARELGKQKKEEQETQNNRRLFKAALSGDLETVSETIKKYDDTLDINYKFRSKTEEDNTEGVGDEKSKLVGLTPIHAAASSGNLRCLRELLNFGLYKYDRLKHDVQWTDSAGTTWQPIPNPLQLAWENGCAQAVDLLSSVGFQVDEDAGRKTLRDRLVETLVPAGKHPERGSRDLVWILGPGIEDPNVVEDDRPVLDLKTAVESAMASLVMRHEWSGLAQFMFATKRDTIELWESWVNMGVIRAVAGVCGELLKMFHVEAGTFTVSNVIEIASGVPPFATLAMIFHGALEVDDSDGKDANARDKSLRDMMRHVSHSQTSFYIAGTSRFMTHALPQSYKYVSQPFYTDHSQTPTQWTLSLNTRGTTYLDVFLTYRTRSNTKSPPEMVSASLVITCKYVTKTDKTNVERPVQVTTRNFEKDHELMVANFDVSKCQPGSGLELIEIRLSEVFVMDPVKESRCLEVMKGGRVLRPGTMIAEWRMCGLPHMMPSGAGSSAEVFIESNSIVTKHGTLQLALHVDEISQEPMVEEEKLDIDDEWFHSRLQLLVGSDSAPIKGASKKENEARKKWKKVSKKMQVGDIRRLALKQGEIELNHEGRVNALADVSLSIVSPMIIEALDLFTQPENQRLQQLSFTENLSSKARKFVHLESKRRGLQHRSRTNKHTGARKLLVTKPQAGNECDFPINIFVGNVGPEPVDRQSFALRIEEEKVEDSGDVTRQVINHSYLTDVSLDEDSTHTFGCYNMALKSDLDGGDFPGSLVTIIRYQYDVKNRTDPTDPPKLKDLEGEALLRGSPDEVTLLSILDDLLSMPSSLIPHSFVPPDGTAEDIISEGRFFKRKKGEQLAVAGEHFRDFIVLMNGAAATPADAYEEKQWDHKNDNAIGNLRDFLYGCGIDHQHTAVAQTDCRIFSIRRSAALYAGGVGPAPRGFTPPAYHELRHEMELDVRTTTVRWTLHGAPSLLSDRSSLVSDFIDVPQTEYNQCSWRLHLIPRDNVNRRLPTFPNHKAKKFLKSSPFDTPVYIGVFLGCTMHESLSQKQLDKGTYEITAMHESGTVGARTAPLAEGYPTQLQLLSDTEIGWGLTLDETWHGMTQKSRWEIECKIRIDPKHCTGFGIEAVISEAQWAVESSIVLAQSGLTEVGNLVGGIAIGGEAGRLGDRIVPKVGIRKQPRSKSSSKDRQTSREIEFDAMENPLAQRPPSPVTTEFNGPPNAYELQNDAEDV